MADVAAQVASSAPELAISLVTVATFWKEFGLDIRRAKLDEVGLHIAEQQEASTASRRKLADATREFKRSLPTAGDASKAFGPLLRSYQEEIDSLTKRAKFAEAAFLELYQQLYEAPDPAKPLAAAVESEARLAELELKVRKLSVELSEYKAESKAIKNQDLTLRKQEETIRELGATLEAKEAELAAARHQAAAEADAALVHRMQDRESELSEMLEGAQQSLAAMQRLYTAAQNQLFELQSASEEAAVGKQVEWEAAAAELERAQQQLAALEAEKVALQGRLTSHAEGATAAAGGGTSSSSSSSSALEDALRHELASLREINSRLRQDVASARMELAVAEGSWGERVEQLEEGMAAAEGQVQELQRELRQRPTHAQVEELQQQVRALQAVGYGAIDETLAATSSSGSNGGAGDPSSTGGVPRPTSSSGALSLEGMLLAKNRKLEHEVTLARLQLAEAGQKLETAQLRVSDLEGQAADQQQLIQQLEEDLRAAAAAAGGGLRSPGLLPASSGGDTSDLRGASGVLGDDQSEAPMVRVLAGQRDRLRQRVQELEEQLAATRQELQQVREQLEAGRADNIALIERLRYVGGYRQQAAARAGGEPCGGGRLKGEGGGDVEAGRAADVVGRYTRLYEDGINPFKEFQGQQRQQKRNQMGVADKAMYSMGNWVYQSPAARLAALCYLVLLHLLVFSALTQMSHHTSTHLAGHHDIMLEQRHDLTRMMHHEISHVRVAANSSNSSSSRSGAVVVEAAGRGGLGSIDPGGGNNSSLVQQGGRHLLQAISCQLWRCVQR